MSPGSPNPITGYVCLVLAFLLAASASSTGRAADAGAPASGALGALALGTERTALLGGRLSVRMPATAKVEQRGRSIMAAPEANEDETRIVLDAGEERLVLMTWELYALSGGDLVKAARAHVADAWGKKPGTMKLEEFVVAPPLAAVAVIPPRPERKREANLVFTLYVASEDSTVQFLAFYVNSAGAKDILGATKLAMAIAASVSAGSRKLAWKAGPRSFPGADVDRLVIDVPEGFVASIQEGPDFAVYRLRKLAPLGKPGPACAIYLGADPFYQYRQAEERPDKVTTLKGKLLGRNVVWQNWSQAGRTTTEAIVLHPKEKELSVHVFCSAGTEEEVATLRTMAETLRVDEPKK